MKLREIKESVVMALDTLRSNKLRSFLTVLGVFIGVSCVMAMGAVIEGLNRSMARQIASLGSDTIRVRRFPPFRMHELPDSLRNRKFFAVEDVEAIRRTSPNVRAVSILMLENDRIKFRGQQTQMLQIYGADADFPVIQNLQVARGRFYNQTELEHRSDVCVIGADIVEALFGATDPLGQYVTGKSNKYKVIGVFEKKGKFLGESLDDTFVIPYTTFAASMGNVRRMLIDAKPISQDKLQTAIDEITESLRRSRGVKPNKANDFEIFTSNTLMDAYKKITAGIYAAMLLISMIALMVGGIGVMNIMLVSVTERTKEIGIRKAIGAKRSDILWQFLLEAMTLTGVGGLLGVAFGTLISVLVHALTPLPAVVPPMIAIVGFCSSVGIGLFFGIWPAWKAARLNPVDALRYE